jgi:formyl-CoA transferase
VRVIDLGTMIAGPVAATLLGDFGAEVIKVEQPEGGDPIRSIGPFKADESLWWNVEGRNKKSVTIDLRQAEGQKLLLQLVREADVVVENFRPGTLSRWNLGYEAMREVNPRIVLLSISGYGQSGPYSPRAAYDRIALAFGGLLNITGYPDRPPVRPGTAVADYQSALFGAFAVMMALYHRDTRNESGGREGQHIDVALYETVFRFTDILVTAYDQLGLSRGRRGNKHFAAAPGDHFETCDGRFMVITVSSNAVFARLCKAMDREDLITDERFVDHDDRWNHIDEINGIVAQWIKAHPVDQICVALERHGLAFSIAYSVEDMLADPHYAARESIITVDHPRLGPLRMQGVLPKMQGTPPSMPRPAPELGQDTVQVLRELLGKSEEELSTLKASGVI